MNVSLHAIEPYSRANGPGLRTVIWFQGCSLGCPGCFNPQTHDTTTGNQIDIDELSVEILSRKQQLEGVTISGGEPFQQPQALLALLRSLAGSGLSLMAFSGYKLAEIEKISFGPEILNHLDVLIAGRYVETQHIGVSLIGSSNQRLHYLTDRYSDSDLTRTPRREVILHTDGSVTRTGIDPHST